MLQNKRLDGLKRGQIDRIEAMHAPVIPVWTFQDRLKKSREFSGLTQRQLAEKLDVSIGSVRRWEEGTRNPRPKMMEAIAEVTGVSLEWLLHGNEGEEEKEPPVELREVSITWTPGGLQITKVEKE